MDTSQLYEAEQYFSKSQQYGTVHPQRYAYSWSGADAKAKVFYSQRPDLISNLESVHTISVSVHEAKAQARSLGHRGIRGLSRGVRTIAGSLILTVVNDHPLRCLMDMYETMVFEAGATGMAFGWSVDRDHTGVGSYKDLYSFQNRMCSLLPPFNLLIEFVSEAAPTIRDASQGPGYGGKRGGSKLDTNAFSVAKDKASKNKDYLQDTRRLLFPGAGLLLQDIEFLDESFVVSVNDMVTEITCSYIARDYKPISADTFSTGGTGAITNTEIEARKRELYQLMFPNESTPHGDIILSAQNGTIPPTAEEEKFYAYSRQLQELLDSQEQFQNDIFEGRTYYAR